MPIYGPAHFLKSVVLNVGNTESFDNVGSVGAAVANTTVQARLPLPQRMKILKVEVNYSAIAATTGTHQFNIVVGNGAEVGIGATDTLATAGTTLWATDQPLTSAADTPATFIPANWDVLYDAGTLLTLRVVTPASTGSITNLKVVIFGELEDAHAYSTGMPNSAGGYGFNPANI